MDMATDNSPSTSSEQNSEPQQRRPSICRACGRSTLVRPISSFSLRFTASEQLTHLCEACKKFYCRYRDRIKEEKCCCNGNEGNNDVTTLNDKCRVCRFRRCEAALLEKKTIDAYRAEHPSPKPSGQPFVQKVDFTKLPCAVCGVSSSGFHFGVVSCEGCKGFFRRSMNRTFKIQYACKGVREDGAPPGTLCATSSNCRKCRLQRCIDAGMSLKEIAIGRHTLRRRAEIDAAIKQHSAQGSFLKSKLTRRKKAVKLEEEEQQPTPQTTVSSSYSSPVPPPTTINSPYRPRTRSLTKLIKSSSTLNAAPASTPVGGKLAAPSAASAISSSELPESSWAIPLSSNPTTPGYDEHADHNVDERLKASCEWFTEKAGEAAAKLASISTMKLVLNYGLTEQEYVAHRVAMYDGYTKCVSEFVTALPGVNRIALPDRIKLFLQAFFPITAAQLSLNFDADRQLPNHLGLDREGPTWQMSANRLPTVHFPIENFLREAGSRFISAITNLQEFSLFCALLLLNPDTTELENVEMVRSLRRRYDLALVQLFSNSSGARSEQRLGEIYQLLTYFRRGTTVFHDALVEINLRKPTDRPAWSSLFAQLNSQVVNMPTLSSSMPTSPS